MRSQYFRRTGRSNRSSTRSSSLCLLLSRESLRKRRRRKSSQSRRKECPNLSSSELQLQHLLIQEILIYFTFFKSVIFQIMKEMVILLKRFLVWQPKGEQKLRFMTLSDNEKRFLPQKHTNDIEFEDGQLYAFCKGPVDNSLLVIQGSDIALFGVSITENGDLLVNTLVKPTMVPKLINKEQLQIVECSIRNKYMIATLIDRQNILQIVANLETGMFHQSSYNYNLINQIPFLQGGYLQTSICQFSSLNYFDQFDNPMYLIVLRNQDNGIKTALTLAICQEMSQIIP